MRTLTLEEAAAVLKIHPKTLQALARAGRVPSCKVGRAWVFVERLLFDFLEARSLSRVRTPDASESTECRSTDERTRRSGGSSSRLSAQSRNLYSKALGLPTSDARSRFTTA